MAVYEGIDITTESKGEPKLLKILTLLVLVTYILLLISDVIFLYNGKDLDQSKAPVLGL